MNERRGGLIPLTPSVSALTVYLDDTSTMTSNASCKNNIIMYTSPCYNYYILSCYFKNISYFNFMTFCEQYLVHKKLLILCQTRYKIELK